jgi:hypothetical protein
MLKALISFLPLAIETLPAHSQQPGIHLFPYAVINHGCAPEPHSGDSAFIASGPYGWAPWIPTVLSAYSA